MKTSISLPDALYEKAEATAHQQGITRSRLFTLALEEYLNKHQEQSDSETAHQSDEHIDTN
jgi:metal-responsive CopG/Arc/MetJ family transcriptional regulator